MRGMTEMVTLRNVTIQLCCSVIILVLRMPYRYYSAELKTPTVPFLTCVEGSYRVYPSPMSVGKTSKNLQVSSATTPSTDKPPFSVFDMHYS